MMLHYGMLQPHSKILDQPKILPGTNIPAYFVLPCAAKKFFMRLPLGIFSYQTKTLFNVLFWLIVHNELPLVYY
jgi:hypothetical protein